MGGIGWRWWLSGVQFGCWFVEDNGWVGQVVKVEGWDMVIILVGVRNGRKSPRQLEVGSVHLV